MADIKLKKIPTIIGLLLLLIGVGAGVYLVASNQRLSLFSKAGPTAVPRQVKVSNIESDKVAISWVTDTRVKGFVKYGTSQGSLKNTVADDRDQVSGSASQFTTHYVTLRNLNPGQDYYYEIGSGSKTYQGEGDVYRFKTAPKASNKPTADTINGKVVVLGGEPAPGTIVYVQMQGGSLRSALSKNSGVWAIPLALTRTRDLSQYYDYDREREKLTVTAQGGDLGTATALVYSGQASPVPDITLGKAHDFLSDDNVKNQESMTDTTGDKDETDIQEGGNSEGFKDLTNDTSNGSQEVEVVNPAVEGENVATSSPALQFKGPVGKKLKITVESEPQTTELVVGEDGQIVWTPPEELELGEHTVTVEYEDVEGALQSIKRSFTVLAAEGTDLPSITASDSATPTPTATASSRSTMPSTESGVPEAGTLAPTMMVLLLGVFMFFGGIVWQVRLSKLRVIK